MPNLTLGFQERVKIDAPSSAAAAGAAPEDFNSSSIPAGRRIILEGVTYHPCVRKMVKGAEVRSLAFVPPDGGPFELMGYRVMTTKPKPPVVAEINVTRHGATRLSITVQVKGAANDVVIAIPVPPDASAPKFHRSAGAAKYAPEASEIRWTIRSLVSHQPASLDVEVGLPAVRAPDANMSRCVKVTFVTPNVTASGLQPRYLRVVERQLGYTVLPWVKYETRSGQYNVRMPNIEG